MESKKLTQIAKPEGVDNTYSTPLKRSDSKESVRSQVSTFSSCKSSKVTPSIFNKFQFNDRATGTLYDVFKRFDTGKLDADTFIKQIETKVGVKATPEFINYIRTEKVGQAQYSKIAHALNYNADLKKNSSYMPPVQPYDQNFHRAKRVKVAGPPGESLNAYQKELGTTLQDYTLGGVSGQKFKQ